jgi:NADH-quinone oxidoreductase subunit C
VPEDDPAVDTVSDIWRTADWHEREIYDMMGIRSTITRTCGDPDVGRLSILSAAEGIPGAGIAERYA